MMNELKPCPFCGSTHLREYTAYPISNWVIACKDCGGKMSGSFTREEAYNNWNRRANE